METIANSWKYSEYLKTIPEEEQEPEERLEAEDHKLEPKDTEEDT